jgi:probable blue pigment (indigoidine) exporter
MSTPPSPEPTALPTKAAPHATPARDLLLTAAAPVVWGSTYVVTTELLPGFAPMTVAWLRALPAGLLLLLLVRQLPTGVWWPRVFALGALNFSIFWAMLFLSAYRLPGGVAAAVGAVQPMMVVWLASVLLGSPLQLRSVLAALVGLGGVALLVLTPQVALDPVGVAAGLAGAASMALGTVLTRKWRPPVPLLTFTAWQLTAGGLLLLPVALLLDPPLPTLNTANLAALLWLGLLGTALSYIVWFRGLARLELAVASSLGFLSPMTAVLLGWVILGQTLSMPQLLGISLVIGGIWFGQQKSKAK